MRRRMCCKRLPGIRPYRLELDAEDMHSHLVLNGGGGVNQAVIHRHGILSDFFIHLNEFVV